MSDHYLRGHQEQVIQNQLKYGEAEDAMDKTIRRITDLKEQRVETYRYWRSRSVAERMGAVAEIVRDGYLTKGIDLDSRPVDKKLVRVERPFWKAN